MTNLKSKSESLDERELPENCLNFSVTEFDDNSRLSSNKGGMQYHMRDTETPESKAPFKQSRLVCRIKTAGVVG
jgi:hypothetical protein